MDADTFRGSPAWKAARAEVMAQAKRSGAPCAICGEPIWWSAPRRHRLSGSVDHVRPLRTLDLDTPEGRRMALDRDLLRVTHLGCNAGRENALRSRGMVTVTAPAEVEMVSVTVPVCRGRACVCEWLAGGADLCSQGPPERRRVRVPREHAQGAVR